LPGSWSLYDKTGLRIPESCVRRRQDLSAYIRAGAETIDVPSDVITIDDPILYLCSVANQWGHFLTEGISRLWALAVYPDLAKLRWFCCAPGKLYPSIIQYFDALGL